MKAYCSLDAVCSAFAFRANLMVHIFQWRWCLGLGHWSLQIPSSVPCFALSISGFDVSHKVWLCSKILTNLRICKYGSRLSVSVHPFPNYSRRKASPHCFTTITLEAEKHSCCDDRTDTQQATYLSQAYTETYLYKAPTWRLYLSLAALLGFWVRNYFCASRQIRYPEQEDLVKFSRKRSAVSCANAV